MNKIYTSGLLLLIILTLYQCQSYRKAASPNKEVGPVDLSTSPVIPADQSIGKMQLEAGFDIELIAAEPLVTTPVAMVFDNRGRMWVAEMNGYMPDTLGTGEDLPNGNIVILEDTDNDGRADKRTVFLDSLILPRSLCLIEDGLLVAEPPNLWYYKIKDDKPISKTLVDNKYAVGGNVEHQPNGLLRGLDNWIYNAKSDTRYRKQGDKWLKEHTHFRGQFGISQDNYGRLYYNDNSSNVWGDYFSPGFGAKNSNQREVAGYNQRVVPNNKVYPIRPTPGINRGYMDGMLDDSLRLNNFTAACSPLIYRGDLFGDSYNFNAFVAEPSANLVKRNILTETGYIVKGQQAYKGKEFLASTDERFRPVALYNGPDGALYLLDMYRGIIQHKTYVTPYLSAQIKARNLTLPLNCGRIYRITPSGSKAKHTIVPDNPAQLVGLLGHANGHIRDLAQQTLIDRKYKQAIPALKQAVRQTANPLLTIHALWTLEGLHALETNEVVNLLKNADTHIRLQALTVIPSVLHMQSAPVYIAALQHMLESNDEPALPYIAYLASYLKAYNQRAADELLLALAKRQPENKYLADAIVSNLEYREEAFAATLSQALPDTSVLVARQVRKAADNYWNKQKNRNPEVLARQFPKGAALFASSCQTCHGADGNGIKSLAPPLNKSQWVTGNKNRLISIVLHGLTGPINVNGHLYEAPEIAGDMPGIANSDEISDEDIAQLLSYIRQSWQNNSGKITAKEVTTQREKLKGRQKTFTQEELETIN
ncbi:DUF7133 domain-containing protein [Pedobacter deserti]|uniref:DUF7133 domain-containing protein n=1 Tax=Pedobacter deserti TaxID=2817382 RepID=UPI002109FFEF|nr:c-type cytochrome [Pedobacter sp. SYSU D00382]